MKSILEQIHKKKTLAQIAPIWGKYLTENPKKEVHHSGLILAPVGSPVSIMQISDARTCIVGEAHGFNGDYKCARCNEFSKDFFDYYTVGRNAFNYKLDKFVEHWNDKHATKQG